MRTHPLAIALVSLGLTWAPSQGIAHGSDAVQEVALGPQIRRDLAALRASTAAYHDFDAATQAGLWDIPVPSPPEPLECLDHPTGGMGYHFLNLNNLGVLDPARPQALIYEPEKDGSMRLVAVEFVVPGDPADTPPRLLGQEFHYVERFGVWALHAWVWRHNPLGIFADWNPNVSCQYEF